MTDAIIQGVAFDERGLIPALVQDAETREVVALVYLDSATLARTLATGQPQLLKDCLPPLNDEAYSLLDVQMNTGGGWLTIRVTRGRGDTDARKPVSLLEMTREKDGNEAA